MHTLLQTCVLKCYVNELVQAQGSRISCFGPYLRATQGTPASRASSRAAATQRARLQRAQGCGSGRAPLGRPHRAFHPTCQNAYVSRPFSHTSLATCLGHTILCQNCMSTRLIIPRAQMQPGCAFPDRRCGLGARYQAEGVARHMDCCYKHQHRTQAHYLRFMSRGAVSDLRAGLQLVGASGAPGSSVSAAAPASSATSMSSSCASSSSRALSAPANDNAGDSGLHVRDQLVCCSISQRRRHHSRKTHRHSAAQCFPNSTTCFHTLCSSAWGACTLTWTCEDPEAQKNSSENRPLHRRKLQQRFCAGCKQDALAYSHRLQVHSPTASSTMAFAASAPFAAPLAARGSR